MLAEPIFQFTEELSQQASKSSQSCAAASATNTQQTSAGVMAAAVSATDNVSNTERIIPPLRASLKRPSKLELKINLNEQQTESMSPMNSTPMSMVHLQQTPPQQQQSSLAQSSTNHTTNLNNSHSHDKNNNFLKQK